jgi:hypothetical protein
MVPEPASICQLCIFERYIFYLDEVEPTRTNAVPEWDLSLLTDAIAAAWSLRENPISMLQQQSYHFT